MSLDTMIPEIWSARLINSLEKQQIFAHLCNREFDGEITSAGDTVNINSFGDVTVSDYVKNTTVVEAESLSSTSQKLLIDQSKYFAFHVDDIDKTQQKPQIMDAAMSKASYKLSDTQDSFLSTLAATSAGLSMTATDIDSTNIIDLLVDAGTAMNEANVESAGRFIVLPPWAVGKLLKSSVTTKTDNTEVFKNGLVTRVLGFDIYMSNNIVVDTTVSKIIAGTRDAMTLAEQIVSVEGYRVEKSFSDAVKGLHVYGAAVVMPDCLLCIDATSAA